MEEAEDRTAAELLIAAEDEAAAAELVMDGCRDDEAGVEEADDDDDGGAELDWDDAAADTAELLAATLEDRHDVRPEDGESEDDGSEGTTDCAELALLADDDSEDAADDWAALPVDEPDGGSMASTYASILPKLGLPRPVTGSQPGLAWKPAHEPGQS